MPTKVHLVKVVVFPVVMYGYENWTIKKAERRRIDVFELWCWRSLLRVPCKEIQTIYPKGNWSWIFIGSSNAEAEAPILWSPAIKNWLIGKYSDVGKIERGRRSGWQKMRWLDDISDSTDMSLSKLLELVMDREFWRTVVHGFTKSQIRLSDWGELSWGKQTLFLWE